MRARSARLGTAVLAAVLLAVPVRPDLEVAVPPGSPLTWTRSFPAITPLPGPAFPDRRPPKEAEQGPPRTEATARPGSENAARATTGLGLLRITTWDLTSEVRWVSRATQGLGWRHQGPMAGDGLYWVSLTPLLRLMLHRALVSETEVLAHMLEIGDPVRRVLDSARTEPSLRGPADELAERLGVERTLVDPPETSAQSRQEMLLRFAREELLRFHPYDPEGAFGRRLFLFGDELERHVAGLTRSGETRVARNATAALGRYATASAGRELIRLASQTDDDVVFVRALAALPSISRTVARTPEASGTIDWTPLEQLLAVEEDQVRVAALVSTLSRAGVDGIVPRLLELGHVGLAKRDGDVLDGVMAALGRYAHKEHHAEVLGFVEEVDKRIRKNQRAFRPDRPEPSSQPDFKDSPEARAQVLLHRAIVLRTRLDPLDEELAAELLALRDTVGGTEFAWQRRESYTNATIRGVMPPVRFQYIETLPFVGDEGFEALRDILLEVGADPMMRAAAVAELPYAERTQFALEALESWIPGTGLRAFALELLFLDRDPDGVEVAHRLLDDLALSGITLSPEARNVYALALRLLVERELAEASSLVPLLNIVAAGATPGTLTDRIREMAAQLVQEAVVTKKKAVVQASLDRLLDLSIEHSVNPRLTPETRERHEERIHGQLDGLGRASDEAYRELVAEAILESVLGHPVGPGGAPTPLLATVPLEEEILLAVGRVGGAAAAKGLIRLLDDAENPHRGAIALALGMTGERSAAEPLARLLLDGDPFVRLCAYEGLRYVTGEDHFADWIGGSSRERALSAERYFRWAAQHD